MDLRKIRKLIEIFHASSLSEIEIREGEESIRLSRVVSQSSGTPSPAVVHIPVQDQHSLDDITIEDGVDGSEDEMTFPVLSPMVGTFFVASSPAEAPFVKVGDSVSVGEPLCLIEAMKIFNQIDADRNGVVVKILKDSGDPVEYGEPLFILRE